MHYYQFNIGDYAKHTRHLTNDEDLAYRRMLDYCYLNESPLVDDFKKVARLIDMRGCEDAVQNVLNDFFELKDGHWHNSRVEKDLTFYSAKADIARQNGKKGGRPPKKAKSQPKAKKQDDSETLALIPLIGDEQYELKQSQVDKWLALYPAIDLQSEVSKMIGWLDANPSKRKTSKGILRFMNSWIARVQDSGKLQQSTTAINQKPDQFISELEDQYARSQAAQQRISGVSHG